MTRGVSVSKREIISADDGAEAEAEAEGCSHSNDPRLSLVACQSRSPYDTVLLQQFFVRCELCLPLPIYIAMPEQPDIDEVVARPAHFVDTYGTSNATTADLVHLHHPGYPDDNQSTLFTLPTCSITTKGHPCAEYMLAWQGCHALAICRPGFLTQSRSRASEKWPNNRVLTAGHYWYHLDDETPGDLYATLKSFREWQYRPEEMPHIWPESLPWRGHEDEDHEDSDCCITGQDGGVETAHLVPKTEWQWWVENNMTDHAATSGRPRVTEARNQWTNVPGNLIRLSIG